METSELVDSVSSRLGKNDCKIGALSMTLKDPTDLYHCSCDFVVRQ